MKKKTDRERPTTLILTSQEMRVQNSGETGNGTEAVIMDSQQEQEQLPEKPLLLLHRPRSFSYDYQSLLSEHYTVLDPCTSPEPVDTFLTRHCQAVRALCCTALAALTADMLHLLPNLKLVVSSSVGVDHIDLAECRRRGIVVTNAGPAFAEDAADCAVALLIDVLRRMSASDRYVRAGRWPTEGPYPLGFKLGGKRVGIVGFGNIGSEIAKRLVSFGCKVAYNSRSKKSSAPFPYYADLLDLAANSDILILCCTLTNETHHIINTDVMKALGTKGVIINIGRGPLIDEKEMVRLLVQGELGGAGLDVFEEEPNVPKELFGLDNVVLSPHCAVLTPESFEAVLRLSLLNLEAFFSNKPLTSLVPL